MTNENTRFREPQLPPGLRTSYRDWYDGSFAYGGFVWAFAVWDKNSADRAELRVIRLHSHFNTVSRAMEWEWRQVDDFNATHPEIFRAIQVWSQGGYGEMSLAEFLNETVPE